MFDVADDAVAALTALVGDAVDADVDDHGTGFDHVGGDKFGFADGDDEDVGGAGEFGEVLCAAVAEGYGAVEPFAGEEVCDGCADDVAAADDHAVFTGGFNSVAFEEGADAHGGGGDEGVFAKNHAADVDGGEAVDIFVGGDGVDDVLLVDVFGKGQLDYESVNFWVIVEELDGFEKLLLGGAFGVAVDRGGEAYFVA